MERGVDLLIVVVEERRGEEREEASGDVEVKVEVKPSGPASSKRRL